MAVASRRHQRIDIGLILNSQLVISTPLFSCYSLLLDVLPKMRYSTFSLHFSKEACRSTTSTVKIFFDAGKHRSVSMEREDKIEVRHFLGKESTFHSPSTALLIVTTL